MNDGGAPILVVKAATNSGKTCIETMELVCKKKWSEECSDGCHGL